MVHVTTRTSHHTKALFSVLILCTTITRCQVGADIFCPLEWSPNGFGYSPIHFGVGVSDAGDILTTPTSSLIGRVYFEGRWIIGTLGPQQRHLTYSLKSGSKQVLRVEFYQILINPSGCLLDWVNDSGGHVPPNAVSSNGIGSSSRIGATRRARNEEEFIGRGVVQGSLVGGRIDGDGLLVPMKDNSVQRLSSYKVLVSVYPKLVVSVIRFQYDEPFNFDAILSATKARLLRGELIRNTVNDVSLSTLVRHSKSVAEEFILTEEAEWAEVESVSTPGGGVPLWYGGEDLRLEEHGLMTAGAAPDTSKVVRIVRTREIEISRTINLSARVDVEVCSILEWLEDHPLPFTAEAEFRLPGMRAEAVETVLNEIGGREVLEVKGNDVVVARLKGFLSGRYVMGTIMENGAPHRLGTCAAYKG